MDGEQDVGSLSLSSPSAPAKLSAKWAALLRLITTDAATKDGIKALAEMYGRIFKDKDALVRMLMADAKASEQEMQAAYEAHVRQRNSLLAFHRAHTTTLEGGFTRDLEAMKNEFQTEAALLAKQHAEEQSGLSQLLQSIEAYEKGKQQERQELQANVREILKRQGQEQIVKLRQNLTSQIDALLQHLQDKAPAFTSAATGMTGTVTTATGTTGAIETEAKAMAIKDQSLTTLIEAKVRKIDQELQRWKEWRNQQKTLKALDEDANGAKEDLSAQIELGLRVLNLAELAYKKELEQKGALSRLQGSLVEGTLFHPPGATTNSISNTNNSGEGVAASTENPLNSFCRRYNQSLLGKVALHERRDTLLEENRMLQLAIQQYLDGVTVNDGILNGSNPLLVVKPKTKTPPRPPRRHDGSSNGSSSSSSSHPRKGHHPCVIEGNHMLQTGRLNTAPFFV
ncbi:hypothetical protein VYU27_000179 [Nannochloropsis oceanica]